MEVVGLNTHADFGEQAGGCGDSALLRVRGGETGVGVQRGGREGGSGGFRFEPCLLSGFGGMWWGEAAGRNFSVLDEVCAENTAINPSWSVRWASVLPSLGGGRQLEV